LKTIKQIKGFKIMELNAKEKKELGYEFAVCMGDYNDIEFECDSIEECEANIKSY